MLEATTSLVSALTGKIWVFIAGFIGGVIGVMASPEMTHKQALVYTISGSFCGGTLALLIGWYFNLPKDLLPYLGALLGLPGVGLVLTMIGLLKNPIATFNRIRGVKDE